MERLAGAILELIVVDFGPVEVLRRLADPYWFQAFGCVLGFDWHSSGVTTVTCGAIKQAYRRIGPGLGVHVAGGKGAESRKTPGEIAAIADRQAISVGDDLIHASRLAAKVDTAALQDGYQLYHHTFFFADGGQWAVVQQGMNETSRYARRYHWLADATIDFVNEPHAGIITESAGQGVLNLVAAESDRARAACVRLCREDIVRVLAEVPVTESLFLPPGHPVHLPAAEAARLAKLFRGVDTRGVQDFTDLLGMAQVGPKTIRSLALIAEVIYGAVPSRRDPATYSFAHGGKDGHPFPVDRRLYDENIARLERAVDRARVAPLEKDQALRRLQQWLAAG